MVRETLGKVQRLLEIRQRVATIVLTIVSTFRRASGICQPVPAPPRRTMWRCLFELGQVRPGETVVTLGTGGVSLAALQFARVAGARPIAVTRREAHEPRLRSLGVLDVIIDMSGTWTNRVLDSTQGIGADVVVDVVGADSVGRSIAATRYGGIVHLVGYVAGEDARFDIFETIRHAVTIRIAAASSRRDFEALARAMEQHQIRQAIDRVFPVHDYAAAFEQLQAGGHFGKVVLTF